MQLTSKFEKQSKQKNFHSDAFRGSLLAFLLQLLTVNLSQVTWRILSLTDAIAIGKPNNVWGALTLWFCFIHRPSHVILTGLNLHMNSLKLNRYFK